MTDDVAALLLLAGSACMVAGTAQVSRPAGLILAGILLSIVGILTLDVKK